MPDLALALDGRCGAQSLMPDPNVLNVPSSAPYQEPDHTSPFILDMLGPELKAAVLAARLKTKDGTIMARCEEGLWYLVRAGEDVLGGLSHDDAVARLGKLK